jgi:hypothetical protein
MEVRVVRRSLMLWSLVSSLAFADSEVTGWGAKGSVAVIKSVQSMGTIGSMTTMTVYDLKAGTRKSYQITPDDPQASDDQPGPDSAAWEAWQKANALAPAAPAQSSPDGQAKLEVLFRGGAKGNGWNAAEHRYDYQGEDIGCPDDGIAHAGGCGAKPGSVVFTLVSGGKRRTAAGFDLRGNTARVQPFWSPDGAHVVFLASQDFRSDVGTTEDSTAIARRDTPSFEVLTADAASASTKAVLTGLQKVDAWPVRVGKAVKARAASAIYASKGNEAAAKALAAVIPGGATVEPLSWKSDCDLVVAVGSSAR